MKKLIVCVIIFLSINTANAVMFENKTNQSIKFQTNNSPIITLKPNETHFVDLQAEFDDMIDFMKHLHLETYSVRIEWMDAWGAQWNGCTPDIMLTQHTNVSKLNYHKAVVVSNKGCKIKSIK